jgi:K+-sensing histidine kinase KdpD
MDSNSSEPQTPSYAELTEQNRALRLQLARAEAEKKAIWMMLSGANRRLQMASAAIKAAVSSLLNYDIFWDGANEHEFLQTINTSVDQASRSVKLLTLAFRLESGGLELKREHQVLQEIISVVQEHISASLPELKFGITLPKEGRPVMVDYEFLMIALELTLEALAHLGVRRIGIQAVEEAQRWALQFEGLDKANIEIISAVSQLETGAAPALNTASPEDLLRLYIALQILRLQEIEVEFPNPSDPPKLRFTVPILG